MRELICGMNLSLDGYIAAPGDDLGWSEPNDELFQWWLEQERAIGLLLYGCKLWEIMSSHWPTSDQQPDGARCGDSSSTPAPSPPAAAGGTRARAARRSFRRDACS